MDILFAFLITLLLYSIVGTFLFTMVEKVKGSLKMKVLIVTFGQPLLTGIIVWLGFSLFSREIAGYGVLFVLGSLLRIPFSRRKYFYNFLNEAGVVTIHYLSELLKHNSIRVSVSEIKNLSQPKSKSFIKKPSELTVTLENQELIFIILDRDRRVSY